jgi:hypothetical protein
MTCSQHSARCSSRAYRSSDGRQAASSGVAEAGGFAGLARAGAGQHLGVGVRRLDAVEQPIRAVRRAGLPAQFLGRPPLVCLGGAGSGLVTVGDGFST